MRVYFDVFRQPSHFNFQTSKLSSFYVFGVFLDSRGRGGPLINVLLRVYFDVFRQTSRFYFFRSMFYEFFVDIRGRGGPLINVFLWVYLDVFRQSSSCVRDSGIFIKLYLVHHHFITV